MRMVKVMRHLAMFMMAGVVVVAAFAEICAAATTASVQTPLPANFQTLPGPQAVVPMPVNVVDGNPSAIRLRYTDPPLEFSTKTVGGTTYSVGAPER